MGRFGMNMRIRSSCIRLGIDLAGGVRLMTFPFELWRIETARFVSASIQIRADVAE